MTIQCDACRGSGFIAVVGIPTVVKCSKCDGKGTVHDARVRDETKAKIDITRLLFPR